MAATSQVLDDVPTMRLRESNEDVSVTWEDQQRINEFGRLNVTYRELRQELAQRKQRLADIEGADSDLMMAIGVETALVLVGEVYVNMNPDDAAEQLSKMKSLVESQLGELRSQKAEMKERLETLKKALYSRLGDAVYLEYSDSEE